MPAEPDPRLGLSEYLVGLIAELSDMVSRTRKADLDFGVTDISVELDVEYTVTLRQNQAQPEFWVLHSDCAPAAHEEPAERCHSQRLTLRLTPGAEGPEDGATTRSTPGSTLPPASWGDNDKS
ncbi:MAG: trypco2 family protein [Thermomicrobiales bacterium]